MSLLQELRRRRIFRVAAAYSIVAWVLIQIVVDTSEPLNLPSWFATAVIVLLAIGFPIALILAWAFDFGGPAGVFAEDKSPAASLSSRSIIEISLLLVLVIGIGWLIVKDFASPGQEGNYSTGIPVVVLMDTFAPRGVYDADTREKSGTNADLLSDALRDLPILIQKEAIGPVWDREVQILRQNPSLILIHRSGFFHSMNLELGFGYGGDSSPFRESEWLKLYEIADNKLGAFLGFVGRGNPATRFLVYSRGSGAGWALEEYRDDWVRQLEGRFPALKDRVTAVQILGGVESGSFRDPETIKMIRRQVRELLQMDDDAG
jgi:hypothetical protein